MTKGGRSQTCALLPRRVAGRNKFLDRMNPTIYRSRFDALIGDALKAFDSSTVLLSLTS